MYTDNTNQVVANFLRDAEWRIAELSTEMGLLDDDGDIKYIELQHLRQGLITWMNIVYDFHHNLTSDGYNLLLGGANPWTDAEVVLECERQRSIAGLNPVPFIEFTGQVTEIVSNIINEDGVDFPAGFQGQILIYNASGVPEAQDFPPYGGQEDGESLDTYFTART